MPISANFKGEFSEFYSAVEKATGKLVDFGAGATKVGTQLNRMVDNFSGRKLIQDATLMVKAIEEVGGVSKLTSAELATASGKAQEAAEKMKKLGMEVPKGLQDVANAGKSSSVSLDAVATSAVALAAGYLTMQAALAVVSKAWDTFVGFISDSITAASDAEAAQSRLIAAMRAQDTAMPSVIALYDDYAAQLQRTTIYEDDAAQAAMALLVQIGDVMPKDMQRALQASAELSAGLGIGLSDAANMVAKAANGSVTALNKLGVETKDVHGKTKDFEGVLASITDKFGGQAEAAANTYAGRMQQLANAWDDVQESVGRAITTNATFLEAIKVITGAIADNTGELSQNQAVTNFIADAVIVAVKAFALLAEAVAYVGSAFANQIRELEQFTKALSWVVDSTIKVVEVMAKLGSTTAQEALPGLQKVQGGVKGWTESIHTAIERTEAFTKGAQSLATKAWDLGQQLDTTRGKTVDVTRAQAEVPGVMNRSTKAHEEQTDALKKLAAAQEKYADSLRDIVDNLSGGNAIDKANLWLQALKQTIPVSQMTKERQAEVNKVMADAVNAYAALGEVAPQAMRDVWLATFQTVEATGSLSEALKQLPIDQMELFSKSFSALGQLAPAQIGIVRTATVDLDAAIESLAGAFAQLAQVSGDSFGGMVQDIGTLLNAMNAASKSTDVFTAGFRNLGKEGGMTAGNLASTAAGAVGVAGAFMQATQGAGKAQGAMKGAMIGFSVAGPWGAAIGGVAGLVRGFFNDGKLKKEAEAARQTFIAAAGGMEALRLQAERAGVSLDKLFGAKKPEAVKTAVDELSHAFEVQDAAMQTLQETASRYGFTLEELGPALQRQELDKQAQQIYQDWAVLNAAGIDTVAITNRMAESVNAYVNQAVAMGAEVPEAMRPMLQKMVDMGTLTDAQGNKVENLEDSGISFAMTMSQGFQSLIGEVGKLTEAIARGLGLAIDSSSSKIKNMPRTIDVGVVYHDPGFDTTARRIDLEYRRSQGGGQGPEGYQGGTDGFRNFGAGTMVMLHGWEAVVPRDEARSTGGGGSLALLAGARGGTDAVPEVVQITINAQGAFFDTPGSLQQLANKVEAALSARHGLKNKRRAA